MFNALGRGLGRALSLAAIGIVLIVARRWLALVAFARRREPDASSSPRRSRPSSIVRAHPTRSSTRSGASFPSGHAAYAGATAVALVLLFTAPGPRRALWWLLAALGIVGMAWSRTYLQVHWLSDVVAGALLGIAFRYSSSAGAQRSVARPCEPP